MVADEQLDDDELDDANDTGNDENVDNGSEEEPQPKKSLGERAQDIKDKYDQAKDLKKKYDKLKDAKKIADTAKQAKQVADAAKAAKGVADIANAVSTVGSGATAVGGTAAAAGGIAATAESTAVVVGGAAYLAVPIAIILAIVVVIALLVWIFTSIFMGGRNKINSMAGGSYFMAANWNSEEDKQVVQNIKEKISAGKLEINPDCANDINWQIDTKTGKVTHKLDIRLLKTIDYLTDRHEFIQIGMLQSNAPTLLREKLRVKAETVGETEGEAKKKVVEKETFSAFYTGQAIAITAIDYSKLPIFSTTTPIEVDWQKTITEKITRPLWEELAFSAGYLDQKSINYKEVAKLEIGDPEITKLAQQYLDATKTDEWSLHKEGFRKIDRIIQLLDRVRLLDIVTTVGQVTLLVKDMDNRAVEYFNKARGFFSDLRDKIGSTPDASIEDATNAIRALGENVDLIEKGSAAIYKGTQVANMVGWNGIGITEGGIDLQSWNKAYEARNKIRQVAKELVEMPRVTAEAYAASRADFVGPPTPEEYKKMTFTEDLVVKQIIVYSPEDDLDNGLMYIDVFPKGITSVSVGGVGIEGTKVETEKDEEGNIVSAATIGDGVVDMMDAQFSYKPIDNGVFSKFGTNYIFVDQIDSIWEGLEKFIKLTVGFGAAKWALFDYWVGSRCAGMYNPLYEACKEMTYRGFLHVAF